MSTSDDGEGRAGAGGRSRESMGEGGRVMTLRLYDSAPGPGVMAVIRACLPLSPTPAPAHLAARFKCTYNYGNKACFTPVYILAVCKGCTIFVYSLCVHCISVSIIKLGKQ